MTAGQDPDYVHFIMGGAPGKRRILTGPEAKETFDEIPSVDVSGVFSEDLEVRRRVATQIGKACEEVGFFYAVNPPVSTEKMDKAFEAIKNFFDQPLEEKMKYHVNNSPAAKGFDPMRNDGAQRESFGMGNDYTEPEQHYIKAASEGSLTLNQWPDKTMPEYRKYLYEYYNETRAFAVQLVRIFALSLGLEETALDETFRVPLTDITIQHYPTQPGKNEPEQTLYPHADYGAFTLLLQNKVAGLEVLNANGIWIPAPPKDHAFIVNTGSYLEVLSNSRFQSTVHRVFSNPGVERFSLPFFFSPDPSATVVPHPKLLKSGEEPKWEPFVIGQRHVKGMMHRRPDHPFVIKMNSLGLDEKDYHYEMLTKPINAY